MVENLLLLILAVTPVAILLKFAFDKDTVEKEPLPLLLKLFIAGTFSTVMILLISWLLSKFFQINNVFYDSFIHIAFVEEVCKWVCVYLIAWHNKEFNYRFDAIVYCIFVSLGFAFIENLGYVFINGITIALLRAITSIPCHAFFAIYMGYYLGIAKQYRLSRNNECYIYAIYSVLIPTALHGIYNYCLIGGNDILYILFIIFIVSLYILSFKTINFASNEDMILEVE